MALKVTDDEQAVITLVDNLGTHSTKNESQTQMIQQMNIDQLSCIAKYILENDASFDKFKDQAMDMKSAFIQQQISGNMLFTCSRVEFSKKIGTIKRGITVKLYKRLKSMTDSEIEQILLDSNSAHITHSDSAHSGESKTNEEAEEVEEVKTAKIDHENTLTASNIEECTSEHLIMILNQILTESHNLFGHKEQIIAYFEREHVNGQKLIAMKRKDFANALVAELNDKKSKGKALKLRSTLVKYEFPWKNDENVNQSNQSVPNSLSYTQIAETAVAGFETSVRKMMQSMNENMKMNEVNGAKLVSHYSKKKDLESFLEKSVRRKDVHILTDLLWTDYNKDREQQLSRISKWDRSMLMKYFQALYVQQIKAVIVNHKLDANKCLALKSRGVCNLLSTQCGLSKGACRNIADRIFAKI